ncbi:cytochrome P450 [Xylaria flabelliformis]|nr:cytochrome P450 [Xylaria flabelliformis]
MLLPGIVGHAIAAASGHWAATLLVLACLLPPITYVITSISASHQSRSEEEGREPPINPYWFPFLGNLFGFLSAPDLLIHSIIRRFGHEGPVAIRIGPEKVYLLTRPDEYGAVLRATRSLTNKAVMAMVMEQVFGSPPSARHVYRNDKSGIGAVPLAGSSVPEKLRVWHHQHKTSARYLQGESLRQMTTRVIDHLSAELAKTTPGEPIDSGDWVELDDFYTWFVHKLFAASTVAIFGAHILKLNEGFVKDFWEYMESWPTYSKMLPKFLAPRAYRARQRVLDGIKKWHQFARQHSDYRNNSSEYPDWDEYWGSSWIKARQQWGMDTGCMDDDALASEDLAVMTAASANALPLAFWTLLEVFRDRDLLEQVRDEISGKIIDNRGSHLKTKEPQLPLRFSIEDLTSGPLLQSVYAEVLRLRMSALLSRSPMQGDYKLGPYKLKQDANVFISTNVAHENEAIWAERTDNGRRPLTRFWAERFLVPDEKVTNKDVYVTQGKNQRKKFSTDGLDGAWIPYGGGALMCPGRHLAKKEMMGSVAVFAAYFDLEVLGALPKMNHAFHGLGAQPPAEPTPVRIRRKLGVVKR